MREVPGDTAPVDGHVYTPVVVPRGLRVIMAELDLLRARFDADLRGCGYFGVNLLGETSMCSHARDHEPPCRWVRLPAGTFPRLEHSVSE